MKSELEYCAVARHNMYFYSNKAWTYYEKISTYFDKDRIEEIDSNRKTTKILTRFLLNISCVPVS